VGDGVYLKYSRDAEREADREGVFMMRRAGMEPRGMLTFLHRMAHTRLRIRRTDVFGHEGAPRSNVLNKMQVVVINHSLVTPQRGV
jgi:predicted Zn-dependent protease